MAVSVKGFLLWYNKMQRYQDAILKKQFEETGLLADRRSRRALY